MKTLLLFCVIALAAWPVQAQQNRELERLEQLRTERRTLKQLNLGMRLDSAVELSDQGAYPAADKIFTALLGEAQPLSSAFAYFFGKNSFHLGKYAQSMDWLGKYLQLKGTTGEFSQEAAQYIKRAQEAKLALQKAAQPNMAKETIVNPTILHNDIPCGPNDKVICPVCHGSTVMVRKNYTRAIYKTCPYCKYRGYLDCDEYNRLIRGEFKFENSN